ncbi:MAG TPA: MBL fold metallo-hydrolase [Anaerolineae bacterium]|nr:MBL fold metallo-hydrolase [Anaerolineae bacterium]HOU23824.1 MBL fold metallo-hydrolase [Anaerolineae bacterium]HQJ51833.1 MBL fold metallo-hydrolase [Anaerolineae bacterium]
MIEFVFLGTSASAPSVERGLSAAMVMHDDQRFLVDCGEGTQRQILRSGLGFKRLDKVLLTHGHLDHILGLGGLVSTFARWEAGTDLSIYAGGWALERVRDLMNVVLRGGEVQLRIDYQELKPGVIWKRRGLTVRAFPVVHRGPGCFGFVFEEDSHRPFLAEEAERLGVPSGPERRLLVSGQPITLADGRVIQAEQVLGPLIPGVKLAWVGDAAETDSLVEHVAGADALVIEATYLDVEADMAQRFGHLTASQAATLAYEAGVKKLYLTHISRRYSASQAKAEAEPIFPNVVVARDLDSFRVCRTDEAGLEAPAASQEKQ